MICSSTGFWKGRNKRKEYCEGLICVPDDGNDVSGSRLSIWVDVLLCSRTLVFPSAPIKVDILKNQRVHSVTSGFH